MHRSGSARKLRPGDELPVAYRAVSRPARSLFLLPALLLLSLTALSLTALFKADRERSGLVLLGLPAASEQTCCGAAPCTLPFRPPVIRKQKRDSTNPLACACAILPGGHGHQVTLIWSDEVIPHDRRLSLAGLADRSYALLRLLRYGRLRDVESFLLFAEPDGSPSELYFPGSFSHQNRYSSPVHYAARVPAKRVEMEGGRVVIYSQTWNHLMNVEAQVGSDPEAEYAVEYADLPCALATRTEVERLYSARLPWKSAESHGAARSMQSGIILLDGTGTGFVVER